MIKKVTPYIWPVPSQWASIRPHELAFLVVTHERKKWFCSTERFGEKYATEYEAQAALNKALGVQRLDEQTVRAMDKASK